MCRWWRWTSWRFVSFRVELQMIWPRFSRFQSPETKNDMAIYFQVLKGFNLPVLIFWSIPLSSWSVTCFRPTAQSGQWHKWQTKTMEDERCPVTYVILWKQDMCGWSLMSHGRSYCVFFFFFFKNLLAQFWFLRIWLTCWQANIERISRQTLHASFF